MFFSRRTADCDQRVYPLAVAIVVKFRKLFSQAAGNRASCFTRVKTLPHPRCCCTKGLTEKKGLVMQPPPVLNSELGSAYVGISRATDERGLCLLAPLFPTHFNSQKKKRLLIEAEYDRLRALPDQI